MSAWDKCCGCPFNAGTGRCSFNRLIGESVIRNLVIDYIETPSYVQVVSPEATFFCDPEDAHTLLCNILRESVDLPAVADSIFETVDVSARAVA